MYHGFDWYGRQLEVREVGAQLDIMFRFSFQSRIVSLVFLVLAHSVEVAVEVEDSAVVSVAFVVDSEAGLEGAEAGDSVAGLPDRRVVQVQAVTSPTKIFTQIILALTSQRLRLLVQAAAAAGGGLGWMAMDTMLEALEEQVLEVQQLHILSLNPVSKSWFAM